ncbi:hypothetical protein MMMB2_1180 [Mycobacterium marinum MB2]|nr:hypothetical protein MMMB2_1180 [Mycobacterium marinum MB2]
MCAVGWRPTLAERVGLGDCEQVDTRRASVRLRQQGITGEHGAAGRPDPFELLLAPPSL